MREQIADGHKCCEPIVGPLGIMVGTKMSQDPPKVERVTAEAALERERERENVAVEDEPLDMPGRWKLLCSVQGC